MNNIKKFYGICTQQCEIANRNSNKCEQLRQGDLLRILETNGGENTSDKIIVKLYNSDENIFKKDVFECPIRNTGFIMEDLWPFMIGTKENNSRIRIYNERDVVLRLKRGSEIIIRSYGNDSNANIKCVVDLIGNVKEAGIGNFIGLKIQNPPQKRETLEILFKNHFNTSSSLLIFRIENLLDALKDTDQQKTRHPGNVNIKSELPLFKSVYSNLNNKTKDKPTYFTVGDRVEIPVRQINYMNPHILSMAAPENIYASPSYHVNPPHSQSDTHPLITNIASRSSSYLAPIFNSSQYSNTASRATLFDTICDSTSPPRPKDWRNISNPSRVVESKPLITYDSNPKPICTAIKTNQVAFRTQQENPACAQLVDLQINEKSALPKTIEEKSFKKKPGRYNQPKRKDISTNIAFTKTPTFHMKQLNERIKTLECLICNSAFGNDTIVLKCMHCICVKCFDISNVSEIKRVQCPFKRGGQCYYKLKEFELRQLRQKFDEFVSLSTLDERPPAINRDDSDDDEELFECKSDGCDGKWFITKSGPMNLFRCPVCKINNCADCKVIHDNMTCTEYKNSLKIRVRSSMLQNVTEKLTNMVGAFKPGGGTNPRQIPDGASGPDGNETLMNCKTKNCAGQWFLSKTDKYTLFKCPTCDIYNCAKCNAIHQNQTCDEYQEARQQRYLPNFLRTRNSAIRPAVDPNPRNITGSAKPAVNHFTKRNWTCSYCTFENFSFGYICTMCQQKNAEI